MFAIRRWSPTITARTSVGDLILFTSETDPRLSADGTEIATRLTRPAIVESSQPDGRVITARLLTGEAVQRPCVTASFARDELHIEQLVTAMLEAQRLSKEASSHYDYLSNRRAVAALIAQYAKEQATRIDGEPDLAVQVIVEGGSHTIVDGRAIRQQLIEALSTCGNGSSQKGLQNHEE